MVDFEDFSDIVKAAAKRYPDPFTLSVVKVKALKAFKFWIEDK